MWLEWDINKIKLSILLLSSQNPYATSWKKERKSTKLDEYEKANFNKSWGSGARETQAESPASASVSASVECQGSSLSLNDRNGEALILCMCYPAYGDNGNAESEAKTFICTMLHSFEFPRLPPFSVYILANFLLYEQYQRYVHVNLCICIWKTA